MNNENEKVQKDLKPLIFWDGFPVCGLLIKKVADEFKDNLIVVATKGVAPLLDAEEMLGHKIIWLNNANDIWERHAEFSDRNFIIHTGWVYKGWLQYDRYMKKHQNAKIVAMVDNRYRGNLRQYLGAIWFRLYLKKYFDAVLVPGKSGQKLMKFLGMDPSRIYTGLYGAYEGIFNETNPIEIRNKEFLFVGQLIERKSVDVLIDAFKAYRQAGGAWHLRLVGDGPLKDICTGDGIILESFTEPKEIARKMNQARVLVLVSRDDNWGTVVCEGAACGMHTISTKTVGASKDIVQNGVNGIVLENISAEGLEKAFLYYENLKEDSLIKGSKISKEIGSKYDSKAYYNALKRITNDLLY